VSNGLRLEAQPLPGIPEIEPGDDLAELIAGASRLREGDVLVLAQKIVSKAEGRVRRLPDVEPSEQARELATELDKDPRIVQLILDEGHEIVRAERRVLITRTLHGFVCANAGIDTSNVPGEWVTLLPQDPDASARRLRAAVRERTGVAPAVVISDSFGRAWRLGQVEVAIGCAGLQPLDDRRGERDALGEELSATELAVADEAAAAAGLVRDKAGREAVVLVRGLERFVTADDGPGATALVRPLAEDLFP
jgi:coenzyme F420-0:L-glutamate ligase / coenzyme F420-1:gamma-L-glutamate ligase